MEQLSQLRGRSQFAVLDAVQYGNFQSLEKILSILKKDAPSHELIVEKFQVYHRSLDFLELSSFLNNEVFCSQLLEDFAPVYSRSTYRGTPLLCCLESSADEIHKLAMLQILLDHGVNVAEIDDDSYPTFFTCETAEQLLVFAEYGVDINQRDGEGRTYMFHTYLKPDFRSLIETATNLGCDPKSTDENEDNAISYAVFNYASGDALAAMIKAGVPIPESQPILKAMKSAAQESFELGAFLHNSIYDLDG